MIDLDAIKARCKVARVEVNRLCQRGQGSWTMSIPVREDDSDIVLMASFQDIPALVAEVKRLRREFHDEQIRRSEWEKMYNQAIASIAACDDRRDEVGRLHDSLEAILDEATSDHDRDIIITECQSALKEASNDNDTTP